MIAQCCSCWSHLCSPRLFSIRFTNSTNDVMTVATSLPPPELQLCQLFVRSHLHAVDFFLQTIKGFICLFPQTVHAAFYNLNFDRWFLLAGESVSLLRRTSWLLGIGFYYYFFFSVSLLTFSIRMRTSPLDKYSFFVLIT